MSILTDLARAGRRLRRSPGATLLGALILALALGACGALVSVVRATLLAPLPYAQPGSLVALWETKPLNHADHNVVRPGNFLEWRDRARSFSDLALYTWSSAVLTGEGLPERVRGRAVSANLFDLLGVQPALGRGFAASDAEPNAAPTMLLSWGLWQRRFGGRTDVVGQVVQTESGPVEVVGVMPKGLLPLGQEEYWEPFRLEESMRSRGGRYTMVLGRLAPGVTLAQAQEEMTRIGRQLEAEFPGFDAGWGVRVMSLHEDVAGSVTRPLTLLLVAVLLLLLIAATNLGNLLLVRADARRRDFAVARAMGASRARVVSTWMLECMLLTLLGAGAGILLAWWGLAAAPLVGRDIPRIASARLDLPLAAALAGVALLLGALLGYASVHGALRGDPSDTLRGADRVVGGRASRRFRAILVSGQIAVTLVLLHGAGLLLRSFERLNAVRPGFDPERVLTAGFSLPSSRYGDDPRRLAFYDQFRARLAQLPGVTGVGGVSFLPLSGAGVRSSFTPTDRPAPRDGEAPSADIRVVDEGYFTAMAIPLRAGRGFRPEDRAGALPVVLVSEQLARAQWPGQSPIGKRITVEYGTPSQELEVAGVVGDVLSEGLDAPPIPTVYYPLRQLVSGDLNFVIRTTGDPAALAPAVLALAKELDPLLPVQSLQPFTSRLGESLAGRRTSLLLLGGFALSAMLLAAVGLYGLLSQLVRLRWREIGIRLALGSTPAREQGAVLGSAARLLLAGAGVGVAGALAAGTALRAFLFAVPAYDPLTAALVLAGLVLVGLLASVVPARQASRVDPATVLRGD